MHGEESWWRGKKYQAPLKIKTCNKNQPSLYLNQAPTWTCCEPCWILVITRNTILKKCHEYPYGSLKWNSPLQQHVQVQDWPKQWCLFFVTSIYKKYCHGCTINMISGNDWYSIRLITWYLMKNDHQRSSPPEFEFWVYSIFFYLVWI